MLVIPFDVPGTNHKQYSVFVVLQDENWSRMTQYDPAEVPIARLGMPWVTKTLKDVVIGYANATDLAEVQRHVTAGEPMKALRHLSRGFAFRPDRGDHDRGPERVR